MPGNARQAFPAKRDGDGRGGRREADSGGVRRYGQGGAGRGGGEGWGGAGGEGAETIVQYNGTFR